MSDYTTKNCTKCGNIYPMTLEYFCAESRRKDGLRSICKECEFKYRQANRDRIAENSRKYNAKNKDKRREYNQINKEKKREYMREYHSANRDERLEYHKKYKLTNKDKLEEYRLANRDKYRINTSRYRARKRQLPDTFTSEQWLTCLEYFNYTCTVCDISFENAKPHADHWMPLTSSECIGTVANNMVCLCASCNTSKGYKLPDIWLVERYGVDKANEVLEKIKCYFDWIIHQEQICRVIALRSKNDE